MRHATRRPTRLLPLAALLMSVGCGGGKPEPTPTPGKDLGQAAADLAVDTQILREASDAANDVVRAAADCEAARPLIEGAKARIEEAGRRVRTHTGLQTVDALRRQVARVQDACP